MAIHRSAHKATALSDGRVLITGGRNTAGIVIADAEIFDPNTGESSAVGSMATARVDHAATLLKNGRVLITGGSNATGTLNSAEIFDPGTGTFSAVSGGMNMARARHTATLLSSGKVLIAGGDVTPTLVDPNGTDVTGTAEMFDPSTGTFGDLVLLQRSRSGHTATLFSNDTVWLAGGGNNTIESFDASAGAFTLSDTTMTAVRSGHDAFTLASSSVLFFGGDAGNTIDEFNPSADTLSLKATLDARASSATLLANDKILVLRPDVAGIYSPDAANQATAFTSFDEVSVPNSTALKRTGQTATELSGDKKILVAGGENAQHQPILQFTTFNPARIWTDKDDYQPSDNVILSGSGWKPNENVYLYAVDNETEAWTYETTIAANVNGGFVVNPYFIVELRHLGVQFHVTALGAQSTMQADVNFTDAGSFDFDPTSQSYTNPPTNTQFIENVTAPKNNGTFSASLVFAGTGGTQIPSSWVTISPGAQTFTTTGSAGDNKTWTVKINVPSGQAEGVYTGHLAASVSGSGGPNPGPGTNLTITIDHTPPGPPSTPDLATGDDTGVSSTDNITNKTNVNIGGNGAEANSTVELFDGSTSLGTTTANGGGNWSKLVTLTAGSPPAGSPPHSITATDKDAAGNVSAPSGALSVTVDTSKPTVTVEQAQGQSDPTNSAPINFTATFNENVIGFTAANVSVSGTAGGTKTVAVTGTGPTYNIAVSGMTTNGTVIATIPASVVTDTAGNTNVASTSTDNSVTFSANVATTLVLNSVSPGSVSYGSTGTVTFTATLTSGGTPVSGANVNFNVDGSAAGSGMTNGSGVATISYNPSALSVGNHSVQASFTAATVGGVSYLGSTSGTLQLVVTKAPPTITWNNPANITYGTALSGTQLNATASVPGTFTYTPAAGTVLDAGAGQTLHVDFTPNDATTYSNASADVTINVLKATPTINWPNPADITYGTALGGTQLNATFTWIVNGLPVTVAGTAIYTPSAGTVLNAGIGQTLHVSFTPSNTTNYNGSLGTATINVVKGTPTINWMDPADITYGTALTATQLDATASVPGSFVYTPAAGTVLNAGNGQVLSVDFTPTDTGNYNSVTGTTVHINVLKKKIGRAHV